MKTIFYHFKDDLYASRTVNDGYMPDSVHFHTYYEISVVRSGKLKIVCSGREIRFDKPCVLLFRPYALHEIMSERGVRFDCSSFFFSEEYISMIGDSLLDIPSLFRSDLTIIPISDEHSEFILRVADYWRDDPNYRNYSRFQLASMMAVIRHCLDEAVDLGDAIDPRYQYIHRVTDYIAEHFSEPITSEEIARTFFISRQKLDADIKRTMHTTLHQYIIDIRTANAAQMLTSGSSVSEVTERCGFANESHFIRTFRKRFNVSPARFQKHCGYLIAEQPSHLYTRDLEESDIVSSDHPITGGRTRFTQKEFMYNGEPTALRPWCNAFCRAGWTGCSWFATTLDNIDCICIMPIRSVDYGEHILDFNYYQWNNDVYYPSLDCSEYHFLRVKYRLNEAAARTAGASKFSVSPDMHRLKTTLDRELREKDGWPLGRHDFSSFLEYQMPADPDVWHTLILDLRPMRIEGEPWETKTIRQFRYYPFGLAEPSADAMCYIESIAFCRTREEAEAEQ